MARTNQPRRYAEDTKVPEAQSRGEIEGMLEKRGVVEYGVQKRSDRVDIMFRYCGIVYRICVDTNENPQENRRIWRSLVLLVKASLVAVDDGVSTFEQVFLPYVVTQSGETLFEVLRPSLTDSQKSGSPLALGGRR